MSETTKCHKCGCTDKRLFHHHKSYGPEEIVMVCMSCHKKLHFELRNNGQCRILPEKLREMSNQSDHAKKRCNRHYSKHTDIYKKRSKEYNATHNISNKYLYSYMMPYVRLIERIRINVDNGFIGVYSGFNAMHGKKILFIDLD